MRWSQVVQYCFWGIILAFASAFAWGQPPRVDVRCDTVVQQNNGTKIDRYAIVNRDGMQVTVLTYGATITSVAVPDRNGIHQNVTLHFDEPKRYLQGHPLFGSLVGRFANRIAKARFVIDGHEYKLTTNAGNDHIHGGRQGFQKINWTAKPVKLADRAGVELTHTSPDGHEGYPGNLNVRVQYLVTDDNQLIMEYWATSDKPTHVNLTNHTYWNLGGISVGNVLGHTMMINADKFLEATPRRFPTGKLLPVAGTPMDFRTLRTIGSRIDQLASKNYDDCYVINKTSAGQLALAARVMENKSGRVMEVYTTAPGVQFYTAKALNRQLGAHGIAYGPYHGFCLETQAFPDAPNHPNFPSTLLRPGQTFHQVTIHRFSIDK